MECSSEFLTNVGVVLGPKGGRRWPAEVKAAIVAETLEPSATVAGVAKRWGMGANMLSTWRSMAKRGELTLPAADLNQAIAFAPLSLVPTPTASLEAERPETPLEISLGQAVLRLPADCPATRIAEIMRAIGQDPAGQQPEGSTCRPCQNAL